MTERQKYHEDLGELAKTAFDHHLISRQSEGRWLLQRPHKDHWDDPKGRWDGIYATEIICTSHGGLYVDGDIDHVIFRYGPEHPEARVRWMGSQPRAWSSYLIEKATIGTGRELIRTWEHAVARDDLKRLRKEVVESIAEDDGVSTKAQNGALSTIDGLLSGCLYEESHDSVVRALYDTDHFEGEELYDIGIVVAPRVFFAHAALQRLCRLLDATK